MLIKIITNNSSFFLHDLTKDSSIDDLKSEILKKLGKRYPYDKLILKTRQGRSLNPTKTLGENNLYDGIDVALFYPMKPFEETLPVIDGEYLDINTFILDTSDIDDIVFFSWGNYIANPITKTEFRSDRYRDWHNVFRQQLPIPILENGINLNKNINLYSVDHGFKQTIEYDIRRILELFTEPIIINDVELFTVRTCDLLQEIGIDCVPSESICNFYFFKHTYGFCNSNPSHEHANIDSCIDELRDNLNTLGIEYYIYRAPLDIETLVTNNNQVGNQIKGWFQMGGKKNRKKKLTRKRQLGGMESSTRLPTPPQSAAPTRRRPNRSSNNDIFGENMVDLFNYDENYLFPDNPRTDIDFSQLDDINYQDIPLEAIEKIDENLDFSNCETLRNYCILNSRTCAFDEQFKTKNQIYLANCKAKSQINKSIKKFYRTEIPEDLIVDSRDRGEQFYNTIEYKMPFPPFIGKMFKEYIRDIGILNKIASQYGLWGQMNVSFMDVVIYFRTNGPEILKNMLITITDKVYETKKRLLRALENNFMNHPEPVEENWGWEHQGEGREWIYSRWLYNASDIDIMLLQKTFVDTITYYLEAGDIYGMGDDY